ncbi:MAG: TIM barrel protein [Actinobacteria bacterium]|nr:MAG: TIM barrel protein [Actinomycetota bacterium]
MSVVDPSRQKFDFGFELIMWDLGGHSVPDALDLLEREGFGWFEALFGDTLGGDYSRRVMTLGPRELPKVVSDVEIFDRMAAFARAHTEREIRLASLFCDGDWLDPQLWPHEFAKAQVLTRFLQSCGSPILVVGGGPPEDAPREPADYEAFAARLHDIGRFTGELGLRSVYHPHIDTFIETREQLDRLMDVLDTELVGLCVDPAHFQLKRDDPVDIFRTYSAAINYVHLKDVNGDESTLSGLDRYVAFCPLGAGIVDLPGIVNELLDVEYDGLVVVEQDISQQPDEDCLRSTAYIRDELGLRLTASGDLVSG